MKTDKWQETTIQNPKIEPTANLPYEPGMQVKNWKDDQGLWTMDGKQIKELTFKPDKK